MPFGGGGVGFVALGVGAAEDDDLEGALISGTCLETSQADSMSIAPSMLAATLAVWLFCGGSCGCCEIAKLLVGFGDKGDCWDDTMGCRIVVCGECEGGGAADAFIAVGGSMRPAMAGDADARLTCGGA